MLRALRSLRVVALALLGGPVLLACDGPPADAREWTPADHDQPSKGANQGPQVAARPASSAVAPGGVDPQLIELAWQKNCATCHGRTGRGDGPQGPMVKAPDLTRGEWQAKVADAEISFVIKKGKNKMPAFDLPEPVIEGLVRRIRSQRAPEE